MAATNIFPPLLLFFFLFSSYFVSYSFSQFTPQNIQVFYPFRLPPPPLPPPPTPPLPPPAPPAPDFTTPTPTPTSIITPTSSKSNNKTVVTAVAATAASTLVLSGLFFLLLVKYKRYRKDKEKPGLHGENDEGNSRDPVLMMNSQFTRFGGVKGVIVDEEGLDVLYWKNIDDDNGNKRAIFKQEPPRINEKEEKKVDVHIQEVPLFRGKSSGSHVWPQGDEIEIKSQNDSHPVVNQDILMKSQLSSRSPPPSPPLTPPPPPPPPPPRPPVVVERKSHVPLPPPLLVPKPGNLTSSSRPVASSQVKLKPLDWDKVNANVGHPMAWDKLDKGSFR